MDRKTKINRFLTVILCMFISTSVRSQTCPDNKHPHMIDLGLPSGTKWACCNIGAYTPFKYGDYFSWAETETKSIFTPETYKYSRSTDNPYYYKVSELYRHKRICSSEFDVAYVKWGDKWQMPTYDQFEELITNCTYKNYTIKNVVGGLFIGSNGNSIFMPAAGYYQSYRDSHRYWHSRLIGREDKGYYWSATPNNNESAHILSIYFRATNSTLDFLEGATVRPVARDFTLMTCPDNNHPHMIDLGLSSGIKWACCNVGATKPEDYGEYYAWGETKEKSNYSYDTFKDQKKTTTLEGTPYDVAHMKWKNFWQMPTSSDIQELTNNCDEKWDSVNGVEGIRFIGPNGRSIFLPAAGLRSGTVLKDRGSFGHYWSGTESHDSRQSAYGLGIQSNGYVRGDYDKVNGFSVRPIYNSATGQMSSTPHKNLVLVDTFTVNGVSFTMIKMNSGTFAMGDANNSFSGSYPTPLHEVKLSSFMIGESEVTQALWTAVMKNNPSSHRDDPNNPVERITWNDCQKFIKKLNKLTGENFRLPTESEWEYAARNDGMSYWSVNVLEWCSDWFGNYPTSLQTNPQGAPNGTSRVVRGTGGKDYWATKRIDAYPSYKSDRVGFRLAK